MEPTIVVGVDQIEGLPYRVTLNGPDRPVSAPADLGAQFPTAGAMVPAGPVLPAVVFDPADPAAVLAWLLANTDVVHVEGPHLGPPIVGDVI